MTTGVQYSEEYTRLDSDVGKTDVASGWRPIAPDASPDINWPASVWDQILSLKTCDAEHGSRFLYRSIETDLLAHIMMRVSGLPLHKLISQELWQPMGAEEDGYFTVDARGYGLASGGLMAACGILAALVSSILITVNAVINRLFHKNG